ncbi:MAG: Glycosyl transferase group 1 [uncultured bacterium]|nr:MAG: Glycosyl transferase group 1 [uncultured bacterium]
MRICSPQLGISPQSILGGEIYDRQILKYLAELGNRVDIILPLFKPHEQVKNWHVHHVPVPFVVPPHLYNFLVLPYLFYLYKQLSFDILRIHSPTFLGIAVTIFKKVHPHVPIVGIYHWLGEGGMAEKWINPMVINHFDAIICDSLYTRKQIEKTYSQTKGKVYAIHNGVDEVLILQKKPPHLINKFQINKSTVVLLFMGLFINRKNPLFLLPIVKTIIQKYPSVLMLYCGKGPLEHKLKQEIQNLHLSKHVQIIPPVFGVDKNDLFNLADIFVHPAIQEGFSLSVIEAMAVGLPVIITDGFSAGEVVINHINGFLCKTPKDWLRQTQTLITDKNLREKMSQENIKIVKRKFKWKNVAEKHQLIFNRLVHEQRRK